MEVAFSANIYMSVTLMGTQRLQPLLLKRYVDVILLIWTHFREKLNWFLAALNNFHPSLHFTLFSTKDDTRHKNIPEATELVPVPTLHF